MKKFSPPQMKEVSFPTPYTPHPTPHTPHPAPRKPFFGNPSYSPAIAPRAIDAIACSVARGR